MYSMLSLRAPLVEAAEEVLLEQVVDTILQGEVEQEHLKNGRDILLKVPYLQLLLVQVVQAELFQEQLDQTGLQVV